MKTQAVLILMSGQGKAKSAFRNIFFFFFFRVSKDTRISDHIIKTYCDWDLSNDCEQKDLSASLRWLIACDASRNSSESKQHEMKFRFPTAPWAYALHPGSTTAKRICFICAAPGVLGTMAGKGLSSGIVVSGRERHASLTGWNSWRIWAPGWTWERQQTPYYQGFQGTLNTGRRTRSVLMEQMIAGGENGPEKSRAMQRELGEHSGYLMGETHLYAASPYMAVTSSETGPPFPTERRITNVRLALENITHFHAFSFSQEYHPPFSSPSFSFTKLTWYKILICI